ncbi:unnamed protein product [Allacma fusca]|uniref:Uncharacterized protein n=1 Tax=Allacma fusca TaxID=39272 RepID=A0A8J2KDW2_9HEXA|nr:unnamed protein product [Allacma fusca]
MASVCAFCGARASRRCASCNSVSYCSGEHQKEHWNVHQQTCPKFKIIHGSNLGKGFVATRDLKACTIVLDEEPVAVGPSESPRLSCLTCGLADESSLRCTRCEWPVCSLKCENHPMHADNECQIFSSGKITSDPVFTWGYFAKLVMGIRVCLLKKNEPQMFQQVLELCSEFSLPNDETAGPIEICSHMRELLARVQGLNIASQELAKLFRIFQINCFSGLIEEEPTSCPAG